MATSKILIDRKIFKCLQCDKSFFRSNDLNIHNWIHPNKEYPVVSLKTKEIVLQENEKPNHPAIECISDIQEGPQALFEITNTENPNNPNTTDTIEQNQAQNGLDNIWASDGDKEELHFRDQKRTKSLNKCNDLGEHIEDNNSDKSGDCHSNTAENNDVNEKKGNEHVDEDEQIWSLIEEDPSGCWVCKVCRYRNDKANTIFHVEIHRDTLMYPCNLCGEIFPSRKSSRKHMYLNHTNPDSNKQCSHFENKSEEVDNNHLCLKCNNFFKCITCDTVFSDRKDLTIHERQHFTKCRACELVFINQDELKKHESKHEGKKYKCNKCNRIFKLKHHLVRHQRYHWDTKKYMCNQCDKHFTEIGIYKRHMWLHDGERFLKCGVCGRCDFIQKETYIKHIQRHNDKTAFPCNNCDKFLFSKVQLRSHRLAIHNDETKYKPKKCKRCEKAFVQKDELIKHMVIHNMEIPFKCEHCSKTFTELRKLKSHLISHSIEKNFVCQLCKKTFFRSHSLKRHISLHTEERNFQCEQCSKSFNTATYLKTHMIVHSDKKPYICHRCDKMFARREKLKNHEFAVHSGTKKAFPCEYCKTAFHFPNELKHHIKRVHLKEERFKCQKCDRGFYGLYGLKVHMPTHSDLKPYKCEKCGMGFSKEGSLALHCTQVCSAFKCNVCYKDFEGRNSLMRHIKCHNQDQISEIKALPCEYCKKAFNVPNELKIHIKRVHLKEENFKCQKCDKGFYSSYELKNHMSTHSELKPYKCEQCEMGFSKKASLALHCTQVCSAFKCNVCYKDFKGRNSLIRHVKCHTQDQITEIKVEYIEEGEIKEIGEL